MKRRLLMTTALAALQLFAALPLTTRVEGAAVQRRRKSRVGRRAPDALLPGAWGGAHVRFEVTEQGANVEYDCAHETVEGRIVVDRRGRFNVYGTHYEEHGGPVRPGDEGVSYRVRLSGLVGGSLMRLTVRDAKTGRLVGRYDLARDREANLVKCR